MNSESDTTTWHETIDLDDLWEGDMTRVSVGDTAVLLVNADGDVHAYEDKCAHQEWPLSDGVFEDGTITCVRHSWNFDARTGSGVNPTGCQLKKFLVQVTDGGKIIVDVGDVEA